MIRVRGEGVGGNDSLMRPRQKREETIKKKRCIWSAICLWHRSKKKSLVLVLETKLLRFNLSQPTHTGCFILWRQKMSSADIIPYCRVEGQKNRTCHKKGRREGGRSAKHESEKATPSVKSGRIWHTHEDTYSIPEMVSPLRQRQKKGWPAQSRDGEGGTWNAHHAMGSHIAA